MFERKYICFDIGKTKILSAVLKVGRSGYEFIETFEQKNPHHPQKIEKMMLDYCLAVSEKYRLKKVAVSAAHIVDPKKKIVSQGKKCYEQDVFSFRFLEEKGFSMEIENDGRCFALGEYHFGKGKNANNILTLNLGTEIGGGHIFEGSYYRGSHGSSLEVSHMASSCSGQWTDWGNLCAGKGIEKFYERISGSKSSAKNIFLEAKGKNSAAKEAVGKASNILGAGIASLVNILDPEMIIFGGSLSKQKKFIEQAVKVARKNVFNKKANYKFAISSLGNKANLLGAASLYFK